MVDRVYRSDLPHMREVLLNMRKEFLKANPSTAWVRLRIDPLLTHLEQLRTMVPEWDSSGPLGGVPMLHSDLVYFRQNVRGLQRVLASERKRSRKQRGSK
jgi:hypothetical protein